MKFWRKIDKKKQTTLILLLAILILSATGFTNYIFDTLFYSNIKANCEEYLARANDESTDLFMGLTAAKAVVGVVEGSTTGVNAVVQMNLQTGDVVQPIYDGVDIAWKASLMSIVSLKIQQLFFVFFKLDLLKYLVILGIILFIPALFWRNYLTAVLHRASKFFVMMALIIYVLFPVGIWGISKLADYVNEEYRKPAATEFNQSVARFKTAVNVLSDKNNPDTDINGWEWINPSAVYSKMGKKWENMNEKIKHLRTEISALSGSMVNNTSTIVTTFIVEVIVLPIIFLILFWQFVRMVFKDETASLVRKFRND
ncbi:MAG: hypothetical protein ACK5L5_03660 [Bacteroidales bacterium]